MGKSQIQIRIMTMMDHDLNLTMDHSVKGQQLFDQVVQSLGVRDRSFFGLDYVDTEGVTRWLKMDRNVTKSKKLQKTEAPLKFKFHVKFWPEDATRELTDHVSTTLFYLETKKLIESNEIACPHETFLQLERAVSQGDEMEYLRIAQMLVMYGVTYFDLKDKKGANLWLGLDAGGLKIYDQNDKSTPKMAYAFMDMRNLSFNDRKLVVVMVDRGTPSLIFFAKKLRINKTIFTLFMGYHALVMQKQRMRLGI